MSDSGSDRRAYPRARLDATCEIEVDGKIHAGVVRDISAVGVFVQTNAPIPDPMPFGHEVELSLRDFDSPGVWLRGRLVRATQGRGVGLEIVSAPEEFYCLLYAFMI